MTGKEVQLTDDRWTTPLRLLEGRCLTTRRLGAEADWRPHYPDDFDEDDGPRDTHDLTLLMHEHMEAAWWLSYSGRDEALVDLVLDAGAAHVVKNDDVWRLLAVAAVSDLRPDLLSLLPQGHRLAS